MDKELEEFEYYVGYINVILFINWKISLINY